MDKLNFVFLIREDSHWEKLFSHIASLKKRPETDKITVVAIGTSILSCLKNTHLDALKSSITHWSGENVQFFLCVNTLFRYGIEDNMLLPEIMLAHEGGLLKVALFEAMGYHSFTLG